MCWYCIKSIMALYGESDLALLAENWDNIKQSVERRRQDLSLEPPQREKEEVQEIIRSYIQRNKRKIYGGYGLNLLVKAKNPADAIYTPTQIADIDFYSPDPIGDLFKICNLLFERGFTYIMGKEAMHQETYSIFVNNLLYCDISYVPRNIYNKMPFANVDGLCVTRSDFMTIDYLRMLTDPLVSYWRMDGDLKAIRRFSLLQKHYPLQYITSPIEISGSCDALNIALGIVGNFIINKKTLVNIGFYAYDYLLNYSKVTTMKLPEAKKFRLMCVPYYEIISTSYRSDFFELIELLKSHDLLKSNIKHTEFYPFFQFTGYSVDIYVGNDLIVRLLSNDKRCIPYISVPAMEFSEGKAKEIKGKVQIGTFQVCLLNTLVNAIRHRTIDEKDMMELYYCMSSHLQEMRDIYLEQNNKSILDDTLFKDFVVDCVGETETPERKRKLLIQQRKKKNQKLSFLYEPSEGVKNPEINYVFLNTSGNLINNPKNLKLGPDMKEDEDIEE
jgi:hypothetical protein